MVRRGLGLRGGGPPSKVRLLQGPQPLPMVPLFLKMMLVVRLRIDVYMYKHTRIARSLVSSVSC